MVTLAMLAFLVAAPVPLPPTGQIATPASYADGCGPDSYAVDRWHCCPYGTYLTQDFRCHRPSSNVSADAAAVLTVLLLVGLLIARASGAFDDDDSDDDDEELPDLDLDDINNVDPHELLKDLEARAPADLDEVGKVQWAAKEAARMMAEASRRRS